MVYAQVRRVSVTGMVARIGAPAPYHKCQVRLRQIAHKYTRHRSRFNCHVTWIKLNVILSIEDEGMGLPWHHHGIYHIVPAQRRL